MKPRVSARAVCRAGAALAGGVGLASLAGWWFGVPLLQRGFDNAAGINPVMGAALCFGAAALALASLKTPVSASLRRLGWLCAGAVIGIAGLKLAALGFHWRFAVDELLAHGRLSAPPGAVPLRISIASTSYFLAFGVALLLIVARQSGWRLVARSIGLFFCLIGTLLLVGYLYRKVAAQADTTPSAGLGAIIGFLALAVSVVAGGTLREGPRQEHEASEALRRQVNLAFQVAVGILMLIGSVSLWSAIRSDAATGQRATSSLRRAALSSLFISLQDAMHVQEVYLLTGDRQYLPPYHEAVDSVRAQLGQLQARGGRDSAQAAGLAQLQALVDARLADMGRTVELREAGQTAAALGWLRSGRYRALLVQVRQKVGELNAAQLASFNQWEARRRSAARVSLATNTIAGLLAVFFLILAGLAINRDFRNRTRAEAAVRESEQQLNQIIELIPNMVFIKEAKELRFVRFNQAGQRLLGYSQQELLGKNDFDFFPEAEARHFEAKDREVLASHEVLDIPEETVHTRSNGVRFLHTKKVAVRDALGRPLYMLGISQDITERKQHEAGMREAKEAAEAASRAKSEFLAKMSHELRTPLNSIIGFSEILEDERVGPLNDKQRRYVANVHTSGRNLLELINDILDLSKVEAGRMELNPSEFDVSAALEQVHAIVAALAEKKQLSIEVRITKELPLLRADPTRFKQIMYNLLGNAVKFTPEGGRVEITARVLSETAADRDHDWLEVAVADTGIGIRPEDQERIFNEFEQVADGVARPQEGTGLGLALTRRLVQLHGGSISVESEPGRGSTFRFRLPIPHRLPLEAAPGTESGDSGDPLVLIVDDEARARDLLAHYLSEAGYRVVCGTTAGEAIALARQLRPAAITLDFLLPDRDGLTLLAELKQLPETRQIPVVVVSVTDRRELGFSLGANDWLVKPVQRAALLSALDRALGGAVAASSSRSVLVVDDDSATLEYLNTLLTQEGFEVWLADGGRQGIELALSRHPAAMVLDLVMPDLTGVEVVQLLRERAETRELPILILTAKELTRADRRRLRASVQAIVPKGIREHLLEELRRICPVPTASS